MALSRTGGPASPQSKFRRGINGFTQPVATGSSATTDTADISAGVGVTQTAQVSSLNKLRMGPTKFRSRFSQSFSVIVTPGTSATTDSADIAAAVGIAPPPVVSSLNPANLGPPLAAPFNPSQFKAFRFAADSPPAIQGSAAINEPLDVATGVGIILQIGIGTATESSDIASGSGGSVGTGQAVVTEQPDVASGAGALALGASGAAADPADVANASGSQGLTASGAPQDPADIASGSGVGLPPLTGSGAPAESPDVASATGTQKVTGTAAVTEPSDVSAATAVASAQGAAAVTEITDAAAAAGVATQIGTAAAVESPDIASGTAKATPPGAGAATESPDVATGSGSQQVVPGIGTGTESPDISQGVGGTTSQTPVLPRWLARTVRSAYRKKCMQTVEGPFGEFFARVGDDLVYGIDWTGFLSIVWTPGIQQSAGLTIRPTVPNGFAFTTTAGGESGSVEPAWPQALGATVTDGAVTWTCVAIDTTSLSTTIQSAVWSGPSQILVTPLSVLTATQVTPVVLNSTNATSGNDYVINCQATFADGEVKIGQIKLKVR